MENKNEDTVFKEHEEKLFASTEDVKNIMEMYTHFEIPLSERLDKALKDFNAVLPRLFSYRFFTRFLFLLGCFFANDS
jgi:predicted nucleic acid-binding OB-fold protein